jgi:hypothetical protein
MKAFVRLFLFGIVALLVFVTAAAAADKSPERVVQASTLTSRHDPAVTIQLPAAAHYAGAARWDLYDICDAELHVFVEADAQRRVQRLYWVQFEHYLPDNTYTYDYPFTEALTLGGRVFDVTTNFRPSGPSKPGSDRERVLQLVAQSGYAMPAETMSVRLVNLLDQSRRQELMFIYTEDLALSSTSVAELQASGSEAKWQALRAGLTGRATQKIQLRFEDLRAATP